MPAKRIKLADSKSSFSFDSAGINTAFQVEISGHLQFIADTLGEDISSRDPLPLTASKTGELTGNIAPYDQHAYDLFMVDAKRKEYMCGGNALWASPLRSLTPETGINKNAVMALSEAQYVNGTPSQPSNFLEFAAHPAGTGAPRGDGPRISPEEPQIAFVLALAKGLQHCNGKDKIEWLRLCLSFPVKFIKVGSEDEKYLHCVHKRELLMNIADAVYLLPSQVAADVAAFKRRKERAVSTTEKVKSLSSKQAQFVITD